MENEVVRVLSSEVSVVEANAMAVSIVDDAGYESALAFGKQIKATQKKVKDYWEPIRKAADEAHKAVTKSRNEMLNPLEKAEKIVKAKMTAYLEEKERKRREQEEELRRLAAEEARRKLEEAVTAAENGDEMTAEMVIMEAEVMEDASSMISVERQKINVDGCAQRKGWEITDIDLSKVPVELNGVVIRPVDEKAVMALIKASKGQIQIPGVTFKEKVVLAIKA